MPTATRPTPTSPLYLAEQADDLISWSGPNWTVADGVLTNDGRGVDTAPWIGVADTWAVTGAYAIEVEIQVLGAAKGYCEQNFGLVALSPDGRRYLGGGLIYTCDDQGPRARITDVTDWSDGYNRDPALASTRLDLARGWHTVRLEIWPDRINLVIDGEPLLEAEIGDTPFDGSSVAKVGLWSQGVHLIVRRISIESIDDA